MDEPTTYLDVRHQLETMALVRKLAKQGKAVVLALHDLCLALETADQIVVLSDGALQITGTPEEVYDSGVLERVMGVRLQQVESTDGRRYVCRLTENEGE